MPVLTASETVSRRAGTLIGLAALSAALLLPGVPASAVVVATPGLAENGSAGLTLSGGWTTTSTTTASGGSFATLSGTSGYAQLSFRATGVAWISRPGPYSGLADVYLDGTLVKTLDGYASKTQFQQTVWSVSGLSDSTHTLKIVRTGRKDAAAQGANLVVDAFRVLDVTAPSAPTDLAASPVRSGFSLGWTAPSASDLSTFRVYRQPAGGPAQLVATLGAGTTTFRDVGLADATTYAYAVSAVDATGNASTFSSPVTVTTPAAPSYAAVRASACPAPTTTVTTWKELQSALAAAHAGTVIKMADGTYSVPWGMPVQVRGTSSAPVWICGSRDAVLSGPGLTGNGGFRVDSSSYVRIAGMTVRNSQKGISVLRSDHVAIADVAVQHIGEEGVHLKNDTVDSVVVGSTITDTGLDTPAYGEGVYVGTAKGNWCAYNDCQPDASDRNAVVSNTITRTAAEPIDLKEGAVDGTVWDNTVDGGSMQQGQTLISVQTNGWVVAHNTGAHAREDGVEVWQAYDVWGKNNTVYANTFTSAVPGYGVRLAYANLGNVVGCDTTVPSGSEGISNKACQK